MSLFDSSIFVDIHFNLDVIFKVHWVISTSIVKLFIPFLLTHVNYLLRRLGGIRQGMGF